MWNVLHFIGNFTWKHSRFCLQWKYKCLMILGGSINLWIIRKNYAMRWINLVRLVSSRSSKRPLLYEILHLYFLWIVQEKICNVSYLRCFYILRNNIFNFFTNQREENRSNDKKRPNTNWPITSLTIFNCRLPSTRDFFFDIKSRYGKMWMTQICS